ncbi:hypothetical protein NSTC731_05431 [Nostoc sp. DSM 114167]|jgi:hypothetical protein
MSFTTIQLAQQMHKPNLDIWTYYNLQNQGSFLIHFRVKIPKKPIR